MTAPLFHIRESRTWVRTSTHTVIREDDPDYARFAGSDEGYVQHVLRVWLQDIDGPHRLRAYLGSLTISRAWPSLRDLRRIYRQAEKHAADLDCRRAEVRTTLHRILRREMSAAVSRPAAE